uniref:Uncharacterized protein n=1 Tax=Ralstonia solanacearum TaxID=305 RepID=A0A0S4U153_RALSL|nr:protein of unknown function [Ralstonia solanacearum]
MRLPSAPALDDLPLATHCTLVMMPSTFLVPTVPSALR